MEKIYGIYADLVINNHLYQYFLGKFIVSKIRFKVISNYFNASFFFMALNLFLNEFRILGGERTSESW